MEPVVTRPLGGCSATPTTTPTPSGITITTAITARTLGAATITRTAGAGTMAVVLTVVAAMAGIIDAEFK